MIQFNLLPDVKLEYIKARRLKRTVVLTSVLVASAALVVLIGLFLGVAVFQKKHIRDLDADIKADSNKLQSIPDLNKILTIQNQLNSLPDLHNKKPVTSRVFGYLQQVTPKSASISSLQVDFEATSLSIKGSADSISTINKFVDTLKFTTFKANDADKNAFSSVVLTAFGRADKGSSYEIDLKFDPLIFDATADAKLVVPNIITTRSETEKPDALFQPITNTQGGQ